ncbi:hypothetical protein Afil01_07120 [Actinorhabdospora filicis]|uniref:DUF2550 family protein n=1 Tax=Actinorhabdospora filicis TaxID=1785913 RepID=A0A9W6W8Q6_9ACTN|nr:hypothetical protein Afil01_07120 [Actinorhabdospora filicis]
MGTSLAVVGIAVLALVAAIALLFARRGVLTRSGAIVMAVRLSTRIPGRGWAPGFGRFDAGRLQWFRMFSYAPRPKVALERGETVIESRRRPEGPETQVFPPSVQVLVCRTPKGVFEVAMTESALTGFLSWLEAAPPRGGLSL